MNHNGKTRYGSPNSASSSCITQSIKALKEIMVGLGIPGNTTDSFGHIIGNFIAT